MEDIYNWYRRGELFYGPYKSYFGKSRQAIEYTPKTATEYSREPSTVQQSGERERIEQQPQHKIKPVEAQPQIKNEVTQEKAAIELKKRPAEYDIEKMGW